jgi:hypothetical protein
MGRPTEIVRRSKSGVLRHYTLKECPDCGKERYVRRDDKKLNRKCRDCTRPPFKKGKDNPCWQGGFSHNFNRGYLGVRLDADDFYYPMTNSYTGYVAEHRLVMAKHLGRCLKSNEIVHHINGDKLDNRLENLELITSSGHGHSHKYRKGWVLGYKQGYEDAKIGRPCQTDNTMY